MQVPTSSSNIITTSNTNNDGDESMAESLSAEQEKALQEAVEEIKAAKLAANKWTASFPKFPHPVMMEEVAEAPKKRGRPRKDATSAVPALPKKEATLTAADKKLIKTDFTERVDSLSKLFLSLYGTTVDKAATAGMAPNAQGLYEKIMNYKKIAAKC